MTKKRDYKSRAIGAHELKPETLMMSYGYDPALSEGAVKPPVFLTSTFVFNSAEEGEEFFNVNAGRSNAPEGGRSGLIYSRFNHPNVEIVEDRLALLEDSQSAVVFSSGMGAISTVLLSHLRPGDVILHSAPLYGGTETLIRQLLPQFGIQTHSFSDGLHSETMLAAMREAAKKGRLGMIFIETPANPTNALVDFKALEEAVTAFEAETGTRPITACDNTLMGPIFQRAVPAGIDLALYSVTKYIGGHSDLVAGAVCGSTARLKPLRAMRGALGFNLDPHTSWMISRSLETLTIRMERAAATGYKIAEWIAKNPYIKAIVYHPDFINDPLYQEVYKRQCTGPGSTFSFAVDASKAQVFKFINALALFKSAVSLGGSESLVCHPASTTHSGVAQDLRNLAGVTDGLVRLSIGLEHPDDLIADLDQAFAIAFGK
ncbi:MAG: cystathionine gamma-synthase family protein [Alphaproteobacteria bacterium]|nr:cystathionine gamma-synthase family protein [Alphaproteobacteria bacterium]